MVGGAAGEALVQAQAEELDLRVEASTPGRLECFELVHGRVPFVVDLLQEPEIEDFPSSQGVVDFLDGLAEIADTFVENTGYASQLGVAVVLGGFIWPHSDIIAMAILLPPGAAVSVHADHAAFSRSILPGDAALVRTHAAGLQHDGRRDHHDPLGLRQEPDDEIGGFAVPFRLGEVPADSCLLGSAEPPGGVLRDPQQPAITAIVAVPGSDQSGGSAYAGDTVTLLEQACQPRIPEQLQHGAVAHGQGLGGNGLRIPRVRRATLADHRSPSTTPTHHNRPRTRASHPVF